MHASCRVSPRSGGRAVSRMSAVAVVVAVAVACSLGTHRSIVCEHSRRRRESAQCVSVSKCSASPILRYIPPNVHPDENDDDDRGQGKARLKYLISRRLSTCRHYQPSSRCPIPN
uniref:Uncharacterized protein n=1 Tax=Anopheles coluzzii TaxID=1518534 RepID=A0A8W7PY21_ANOCL